MRLSIFFILNNNLPFKENEITDHPIQFYAATKKSNEIMAHSYSYLYNIHSHLLIEVHDNLVINKSGDLKR